MVLVFNAGMSLYEGKGRLDEVFYVSSSKLSHRGLQLGECSI